MYQDLAWATMLAARRHVLVCRLGDDNHLHEPFLLPFERLQKSTTDLSCGGLRCRSHRTSEVSPICRQPSRLLHYDTCSLFGPWPLATVAILTHILARSQTYVRCRETHRRHGPAQ